MKLQQLQKEVLLLPFMQIASGHHRVADTLLNELQQCSTTWNCHKVDILSYSFGTAEKVVSTAYLSWIKRFPNLYHWIYYQLAYKKTTRKRYQRHYLYETLFMFYFKRLIQEKKPSILFFTHSLPSNMASILKQKNQLQALTINVYTDFFVNHLWGISGIDFHFVPSISVKHDLIEKGVPEQNIVVTGIPIDRVFRRGQLPTTNKDRISILVTGGNLGVGGMIEYLSNLPESSDVHYHVLCGENKDLYRNLLLKNQPNITPYPYISCRHKMNQLYDQVDGVLTKAGGVTLSECLIKRKPIFIYHPLPGQERINVNQLKRLGLVTIIESGDSVETKIRDFLSCPIKQTTYQEKINDFHQHLEKKHLSTIIDEIASSYFYHLSK